MTLVEDLQALDLSAVVNARATITVTANGPQLQGVLSAGVGPAALGGLGTALDEIRAAAEHPETLLDDVLAALPALGAVPGLEDLDLDAWEHAVREGAEFVADLVAALGGDLSRLGDAITGAGGDLAHTARLAVDDFVHVGVDELARLRRLVDGVAAGVPADPDAFARIALDVLFPGPSTEVLRVRAAVSGVLDGAAGIALPATRVAGLLDAHAAVAAAAEGGDPASLRAAIAGLERTRDDTLRALESDLRLVVERLHGLPSAQALEAVGSASGALSGAQTGILEFLDALRAELEGARTSIAALDPAAAHAAITEMLDGVEARAEELLVAPVEQRVDAVEGWVRDLFAHLPLRTLRAELSSVVERAVTAIEDADLDGPAEALRSRLDGLEQQVAGIDLGTVVRDALEEVENVISGALNAIVGALEAIGTAVDALADGARELVEDAVEILRALSEAVAEAKQVIEDLPIEEARQEVVDAIRALRAKAEELLSGTALPEGVRPLVDQLAGQLRALDVEAAVLGPIDQALAEFHVLDDIGLPEAVKSVQGTLSNLVPAQIAVELEAELDAVLDGIRAFRPDGLKQLVEDFLGEAADAVEDVDLGPVRAVVHEPFGALLALFDELKPSALLRPVLAAYDDLVGAAALPDPVAASQQLIGAAADAAQQLTPPLTGAVQRVVPQAERVAAQVPAAVPPGTPRPGDIVRLFGWLPARLREALAGASADARAAVLAGVDTLVGGLAVDLRRLQTEMWAIGDRLDAGLETLLAPLAVSHMRAQLALRGRVSAGAGGAGAGVDFDLDLNASIDLVASTSPAAMREALRDVIDLATGTVERLAADVAAGGDAIDAAASGLEGSPLATLAADADAFLAALDPEPLALELDALVDAALARLPDLVHEIGAELEAVVARAQRILLDLNPAVMLQRFLRVLDAVRDELDVLNPHTIARELDVIHDAARATLEAYDPAVLVDEVGDLLRALATAIRNVDLSDVPGQADLPELAATVARVEAAVPRQALENAGAALAQAGEALRSFDLVALVDEVDALPARVQDAMHAAVRAVKEELLALLGALRYQQVSASASVSASGSVG